MALLGKVGSILRHSSAKTVSSEVSPLASVYQAIRCMSSVPNSQFTIGGVSSQNDEQAFNVKEHLGSRVGMTHAIYRRSFGGIGAFGGSGYGVRSYSAGAVASHSSTTALANVAGGSALNLALFWHINSGVREILADYVHHEMTRNVMLIYLRLFLIIAAKDVFVSLVF